MESNTKREQRVKKTYKNLKDSGDLTMMMPSMTGDWETDKEEFISNFVDTQKLLENLFDGDEEFE